VIKSHWKSVYKSKKHRAFNAKVNDSNDNDFSFEFKEKKKISNEIAVLFKKTVNKMFKFKWVANSEFFSYIIDQL